MADAGGPPPGWYPDPAGSPGLLRYWDGRTWSDATRAGTAVLGSRPGRIRWLLGFGAAGLVLLVAVVVVIASVVRSGSSATPTPSAPAPTAPATSTASGTADSLSCVERDPDFAQVPASQGRVRSGHLSYPQLGSPFAAPNRTTLFRFGYLKDVASQFAVLRFHGSSTGGAETMLARLPIADGFTTPKQVAALLYDCIRDRFPGGEEKVMRSQTTVIDGQAAWIIRAHLGYGPPVEAGVKNEEIILAVVRTGVGENGLFYADIPDTHPELVAQVEQALAKLTVS